MMKKPEEIKKGLECCTSSANCDGCPYYCILHGNYGCEENGCDDSLLPDALVYIQQLEDKVSVLGRIRAELTAGNTQLRDAVFKQEIFKRRLEEERSTFESLVPRWIPVEERMPEHGKNVLVHVANRVGMWHTEIDWQKDNGEWANNADCEWYTITHWMPLPEPPEEVRHE